jgi:hypothetical protein
MEINKDFGCVKLNLNLDYGIYSMGLKAASGKTYLYKLLSSTADENNAICLTYPNYRYVDSLYELAVKLNSKIIILDRYDMYVNTFKDDIIRLKDSNVILLDSKHGTDFDQHVNECIVRMRDNVLEVLP